MENNATPLMVTIRCITYNHEPYIRQCLEGFVMQKTNFRFEAIVHDDASTDGTAAIIREYAEKYPDIIKPVFETENQYSKHDGAIRRILNEHTHGKYVALCEGDDYWIEPYKLQKQVDFLEEHEEYAFSCTAFRFYYQKDDTFSDFFNGIDCEKQTSRWLTLAILNHNSYRIQTNTVLFRRDIYLQLLKDDPFLYSSNYFLMGDTQLWVGLLSYGKLYYLNQITSVYRVVDGSACRQSNHIQRYRFELSCWEMRLYLYRKMKFRNDIVYMKFLFIYTYHLLRCLVCIPDIDLSYIPSNFIYSSCKRILSVSCIRRFLFDFFERKKINYEKNNVGLWDTSRSH